MIWMLVSMLLAASVKPGAAAPHSSEVGHRASLVVADTDSASAARPPLQIMGGPGFRALLARVAKRCPASRVRYATPAALLDLEEQFEAGLDSSAARRLHAEKHLTASGDYPRCVGRDGASCPAGQALEAIERARLTDRFTSTVCAHGGGPWG